MNNLKQAATVTLFMVAILFALYACTKERDMQERKDLNNSEKKIAELEKMNTEKQNKIITLALTVKVMSKSLSHFDHGGMWNFFNEKEFWESTYDVDPNECLNGCAL